MDLPKAHLFDSQTRCELAGIGEVHFEMVQVGMTSHLPLVRTCPALQPAGSPDVFRTNFRVAREERGRTERAVPVLAGVVRVGRNLLPAERSLARWDLHARLALPRVAWVARCGERRRVSVGRRRRQSRPDLPKEHLLAAQMWCE